MKPKTDRSELDQLIKKAREKLLKSPDRAARVLTEWMEKKIDRDRRTEIRKKSA